MENEISGGGLKMTWKMYLGIFVAVVGLGLGGYGYYWYVTTTNLIAEAKVTVEQARKFEEISGEIKAEGDRCRQLISQAEGDFASFEYCKEFVNWAEKLDISS